MLADFQDEAYKLHERVQAQEIEGRYPVVTISDMGIDQFTGAALILGTGFESVVERGDERKACWSDLQRVNVGWGKEAIIEQLH